MYELLYEKVDVFELDNSGVKSLEVMKVFEDVFGKLVVYVYEESCFI